MTATVHDRNPRAARTRDGQRLAGGIAIVLGGAVWLVPALLPAAAAATPLPSATAPALALLGAVLLQFGIVGDRAPLSWVKVGGILTLFYFCSWLALHLVPDALAAANPWGATSVMRLLVGLIAAIVIAKSWPVRGYDRWAMLVVVLADGLNSLVWGWVLLAAPSAALITLVGALFPLALVALGASHIAAALRARRDR
ncbi:hypothetical protein [Agrococcus lahaulensis]|uniref:hypothetical protein n=1 Tax=Agrococcus lahaulensis TaxID=341722 RepID=UPI00047DDE7B|nr:hypothetical protein [Agrococcus lahaulensis]